MPYPVQLAGARNAATQMLALQQMAGMALALDTRAKAIQHAYATTTAADYELPVAQGGGGFPTGTGATYQQLMTDLNTFLSSPAWTKMMQFVDQYRDLTG